MGIRPHRSDLTEDDVVVDRRDVPVTNPESPAESRMRVALVRAVADQDVAIRSAVRSGWNS